MKPAVWSAIGPYRGRQGVAKYFQAIGENRNVKKLEPQSFLASDRAVAVVVEKDIEVKRTGKSYRGLLTSAVIEAYRTA